MAFSGFLRQRVRDRVAGCSRGVRSATRRRSDQIVGEDELCPYDRGKWQFHLDRSAGETNAVPRSSEQAAAETLASVDRPSELDLSLETAETIIVLGPNQWPVDARGADLKHVGAGN